MHNYIFLGIRCMIRVNVFSKPLIFAISPRRVDKIAHIGKTDGT